MEEEVRRALISPWLPSLGFLHSGGTDEMKSNGEREETVRDGGGGEGAEPHFKLSCVSAITVKCAT